MAKDRYRSKEYTYDGGMKVAFLVTIIILRCGDLSIMKVDISGDCREQKGGQRPRDPCGGHVAVCRGVLAAR